MIKEIDLGEDIQVKVKWKCKEYSLREPTVDECEALKSTDEQKIDVVKFLANLGMPADVTKSMGISKATKLVEGLMDLIGKKK